jgi:L-ectoine synthase
MTLRIIRKSELSGTHRHVRNHAYETYRFLLEHDALGLTITDITLQPGVEETYGYDEHIEVAYCLEGQATVTELPNGIPAEIAPGTMWIAQQKDRFSFIASEPTRLICVFTPAFAGNETGFAKTNSSPDTGESGVC